MVRSAVAATCVVIALLCAAPLATASVDHALTLRELRSEMRKEVNVSMSFGAVVDTKQCRLVNRRKGTCWVTGRTPVITLVAKDPDFPSADDGLAWRYFRGAVKVRKVCSASGCKFSATESLETGDVVPDELEPA